MSHGNEIHSYEGASEKLIIMVPNSMHINIIEEIAAFKNTTWILQDLLICYPASEDQEVSCKGPQMFPYHFTEIYFIILFTK